MALSKSRQKFIEDIAGFVQKYAYVYGIMVHSPIIAQAILESGWGESKLAAVYHNYFGLKCGTKWTGKSVNLTTQEEYQSGTMTTIKDNFRAYDSMEEGVKGYFEFIQLARYQNLRGIKDPKKYLETIKADGYATSSTYVTGTYKVITTYGLTKYDGTTVDKEETTMGVRMSNCGHDENGRYSGGRAGDQTGTEWYLRSWYSYPWNYIIRWKDDRLGDLFADLAIEAAKNNLIGYDQYQRETFWEHLKASGYHPSKITIACEADCSSGTIALIRAVGYLKGIKELQQCNATYTGNMMSYFQSANGKKYFEILTGKYLTNSSYAKRGDINLNTAHHVNITVDNGANALNGTSNTSKKSVEVLAGEVIAGKWGAGEARKSAIKNAGYDYEAVQNRVNEILSGKKSITEIAKEVIAGKWGNGADRKKRLEAAGYNYSEVQKKVNELL